MNPPSCVTRLALVLAGLVLSPVVLAGQLISLKTVPVAAGDQFLIFPSENIGMGGVGIALDDRLFDPFSNPAMGAVVGEPQVLASPTFYSISNNAGTARTLPASAWFKSADWFGGTLVALQQLKEGGQFFGPQPFFDILPSNALSRQSSTNKYAHLSLGKSIRPDLSIGVSTFLADLSAMDGVEHLYALASNVGQSGAITDLRVGLRKEFEGDRKLEAVALYNRFNMAHDVTYVDWVLTDTLTWIWEPQTRLEENLDRSRTWGGHLGYHQAVGTDGWRVGGSMTVNRKDHPKIPNYEIMNIPRDPGHSTAFDVGVGIAKVTENTKFGIDIVYQPAASETWAEALDPVETVRGDTIPSGGKTVENSFDFSNAFVNMGVTQNAGPVALQLGLQVRAYDFHLDQFDNVARTSRRQDEDWMEWVPSWGLQVRLADFELRYFGRVTTGTGRPGVAWSGVVADRALAAEAANDILLAPTGPLTLQDATVMTHQFSVAIPIR